VGNYSFLFLMLPYLFGCHSNSSSKSSDVNKTSSSLLKNLITNKSGFKVDKDNNYQTVQIGSQVWFAENLKTTVFNNGDSILQVKSSTEWHKALINKIPAWCYQYYDNKYGHLGKIYNWYAVKDTRGIAPVGYHVPTKIEWDILIYHCGGNSEASNKLKSDTGWIHSGWDYSGTNEFGFSALPTGKNRRYSDDFDISSTTSLGSCWWTSSVVVYSGPRDVLNNFIHTINIDEREANNLHQFANGISEGLFIRCIKD
jgi:uncharacterized protein (TIGR02145 family)